MQISPLVSYFFVRKSSPLLDLRHQNSRVSYQREQLLLLPQHASSDNGDTSSILHEQLPSIGHLFRLASRDATLKSHGSRKRGVSCKLLHDSDLASDPGVAGLQCAVFARDATVCGFRGVESISSGRNFGEVRAKSSIMVHRAVVFSLALRFLLLRSKLPPVSELLVSAPTSLLCGLACRIGCLSNRKECRRSAHL